MKILPAQLLPDISSFPPAPVSAVFFLHSLDTDTSKLLVCALKASAIFHTQQNHCVAEFARLQPLEFHEEGGSGRKIIF